MAGEQKNEQIDVMIVGAGISGVSAAYHLQQHCPNKRFAVLEARADVGGTWDLFRYPGIRSDSDMHTLGFKFRPWREAKSIADGPSILKYVKQTVLEEGIKPHIRFQHSLLAANWSSHESRWQLTVNKTADNGAVETVEMSCSVLLMCSGYYNYAEGYTPEFDGINDYQGEVVHPQHWPESLDYAGKNVLVIGSGATAMTLVPAMAATASKVTMVQRSPTYVVSRPDQDKLANFLRKVLPEKLAYRITRWKNINMQRLMYNRTRTNPKKVKEALLGMVREELGPDYDIDKHFTPSYNPWDQRLCLVPNADLFEAIRSEKAEVVTEQIAGFTPNGLRLASGTELDADIIVTATGLKMQWLAGVTFTHDDQVIDFPATYTYKGMMYSGVPNLIQTFGYVNASWTLRADLTSEFACRVINHMDEVGVQQVTPQLREEDQSMPARPWIDDFSAGYMQRVMHMFPKQGDRMPWLNTQNFAQDKKAIEKADLEDGVLMFADTPPSDRVIEQERVLSAG